MSISNLFYPNNYDLFANSLILSNGQAYGPTGPTGPMGPIEIIGSTGPITIIVSPNSTLKLCVMGCCKINSNVSNNNIRMNRGNRRHSQ
jgi:hypothetical protein